MTAFYMEEDWRGARAWAACRREFAAHDESLDWQRFVPPPVPDAENFAMASLFARALAYRVDPETGTLTMGPSYVQDEVLRSEMPYGRDRLKMPLHFGNWELGQAASLKPWQDAFRKAPEFPAAPSPQTPAEDVLLALTRYTAQFDGLAEAATRPLTRFPYPWDGANVWSSLMPGFLIQLQHLDTALEMRATAHVAAGQAAAAARDVALMLRLRKAAAADDLLVGHVMNVTCTGIMLTPVWEGLAARRWSAGELDGLQAGLAGIDLLADYTDAVRRERAVFLCHGLDQAEHNRHFSMLFSPTFSFSLDHLELGVNRLELLALYFSPRGWFDLAKAAGSRLYQRGGLDGVDVRNHRVRTAEIDGGELAAERLAFSPEAVLLRTMLPTLGSLARKTAFMQAHCDQAATACALERYHLDHQAYPDELDALVPRYLDRVPTDLMAGAPMRYQRVEDGRYLLYSIGWNGRDDGGQLAWKADGRMDYDQGDWIWQYQPLAPPAKIQRSK